MLKNKVLGVLIFYSPPLTAVRLLLLLIYRSISTCQLLLYTIQYKIWPKVKEYGTSLLGNRVLEVLVSYSPLLGIIRLLLLLICRSISTYQLLLYSIWYRIWPKAQECGIRLLESKVLEVFVFYNPPLYNRFAAFLKLSA